MEETVAIVLAAGKGTRMKSDLPKVLHPVCGRPMIEFVLDALIEAGVSRAIVVVGYAADRVREALAGRADLTFVDQTEQLGTGHAVMVCREHLHDHHGPVLIVTGDSPLAQPASLMELLNDFHRQRPAAVLGTLVVDNPSGLGRIVRGNDGTFEAVVEERDATPAQREIREVNMSTYVFDCRELLGALDQLTTNNQQREYYITDCPGILKRAGKQVRALPVLQPCEGLSINTLEELAIVEAEMQKIGY